MADKLPTAGGPNQKPKPKPAPTPVNAHKPVNLGGLSAPRKGSKGYEEEEEKDLETLPEGGEVDVGGDEAGAAAPAPEGSVEVEPYSSQVLRRLHENASILLEEYDEMVGPLEHEPIKKELLKDLERLVADIERYEGLHSKHHPDLESISPADTKDIGDEEDATDATSGGGEGPPPGEEGGEEPSEEKLKEEEEAPEDMETKALRRKYIKALRKHYRKQFPEADKEDRETNVNKKGGIPGKEEDNKGPGKEVGEGRLSETKSVDAPSLPGSEEHQEKPGEPDPTGTLSDNQDLQPHEAEHVKGASAFCKELSETQDFSHEHRLKSYHFHKGLGDIVGGLLGGDKDVSGGHGVNVETGDISVPVGNVGNPMKGLDGAPGYEEHQEKPGEVGTEQRMGAVKNASEFLGRMAHETAFGDSHRQEAFSHHKALEGAVPGYEENQPPAGEEGTEERLGEVQEKEFAEADKEDEEVNVQEGGKGLKAMALKNKKRLEHLMQRVGVSNGATAGRYL